MPRRHSIARFNKRGPRENMHVLGKEAVLLQDRDLITKLYEVGTRKGGGWRACMVGLFALCGNTSCTYALPIIVRCSKRPPFPFLRNGKPSAAQRTATSE